MVLRVLGTWFLLAGVVALVIDITRTLAADALVMTRIGEHWFQFHSDSLNASQAGIQRYVHPALWDPVILALLQTPTWLVSMALGILLILIGRRRRRHDVFSN
jgi:hypothetical protein